METNQHQHSHGHAHHHHHHHHAVPTTLSGTFITCIVLNLLFVVVEAGAGLYTNSLGLLSDAGHNLSDVFSLLLSLFAIRMALHRSNRHFTYGYKKSTILVSLVNAMSRELILRSLVDKLREFYDFILIDCMPSLGMMTINALACADSVLIPVQAAYLPVKGLQQLIKTIGRVKKQLNPKLKIEGILLTMVDYRTNYARDISLMVYDTYSASIKVFGSEIPMSVRAAEVSVEGKSIYSYDPKGKVACAYKSLTEEVLKEDR